MITIGYADRGACIVRALVAIGLGAMMIAINHFTTGLVKIIAIVLAVLSVVSTLYGIFSKKQRFHWLTATGGLLVLAVGALMFFWPESMARFCVILLCIAIVLGAALQLLVFSSVLSFAGLGWPALVVSILLLVGGIAILFSDTGLRITSVIIGVLAVIYGVQELANLPRVRKVMIDSEASAPSPGIEEQ